MTQYPDSLLAMNLKACNTFRIFDGKKAEQELQAFKARTTTPIQENDLIRHNLVVFRGGENAIRDLVPLVGLIPEARLNLVIYYLRKGELQPAFDLMKDVEPTQPQVRTDLGAGNFFTQVPKKSKSYQRVEVLF